LTYFYNDIPENVDFQFNGTCSEGKKSKNLNKVHPFSNDSDGGRLAAVVLSGLI
jgi:hypothetical protein